MKMKDCFHKIHYTAVKAKRNSNISVEGEGSTHKIFMFSNGYGASVVQGFMSFDVPELAVICFENPTKLCRSKKKRIKKKFLKKAGAWGLIYSTPITNDIKRYDNNRELQQDLAKISKLDKFGQLR